MTSTSSTVWFFHRQLLLKDATAQYSMVDPAVVVTDVKWSQNIGTRLSYGAHPHGMRHKSAVSEISLGCCIDRYINSHSQLGRKSVATDIPSPVLTRPQFIMFKLSVSVAAVALLLPTIAFGSPTIVERATTPVSTSSAKLHSVAKSKGKLYFGSATDNPELTTAAYTAILDDNTMFGQITAANSMKWDATEPSQGQFTFSGADQIANLAKTNGQLLRGK